MHGHAGIGGGPLGQGVLEEDGLLMQTKPAEEGRHLRGPHGLRDRLVPGELHDHIVRWGGCAAVHVGGHPEYGRDTADQRCQPRLDGVLEQVVDAVEQIREEARRHVEETGRLHVLGKGGGALRAGEFGVLEGSGAGGEGGQGSPQQRRERIDGAVPGRGDGDEGVHVLGQPPGARCLACPGEEGVIEGASHGDAREHDPQAALPLRRLDGPSHRRKGAKTPVRDPQPPIVRLSQDVLALDVTMLDQPLHEQAVRLFAGDLQTLPALRLLDLDIIVKRRREVGLLVEREVQLPPADGAEELCVAESDPSRFPRRDELAARVCPPRVLNQQRLSQQRPHNDDGMQRGIAGL
mmetsp:Transcript_96528/g.300595  ORF Transcript_96528/g.300595 Transcript_96528/m.300595 type:complete len:350 (-) Transcript_96528:185-1234(-)